MFKNPQWNHVKNFEKITLGQDSISFESLFNGVLNYYNVTEEEVIEQYDSLSKNEFDKKVLYELSNEIPNPDVVKSCYYRCNKSLELTEKVENRGTNWIILVTFAVTFVVPMGVTGRCYNVNNT